MSRPYLKKIILVAGGVTVPALLMVCVEAWMNKMGLAAPGSYVLDYVFGTPWQHRNLGHVVLVWFDTDFILVFSVPVGLYLFFTKLLGGHNDRS
jgi:hypothetical protein